MNDRFPRIDVPSDLAEILEELTNEFNLSGEIDLDQYVNRAPEHADQIRRFASAIEVMSQLEVACEDDRGPGDGQPTATVQRETLGDFRLIREIGRGGMGVVYEAEQRSLGRLVAVKILPFAHLMDQRHLERFKNEARAASMLRHPHIVNVFQVGCERGVYFYAMDLVEGESLAGLVRQLASRTEAGLRHDERQADIAAETTRLATISTEYVRYPNRFFQVVANLGAQAADALHFAHQQGVIHRDIKPSNLLLDRDGQVYVTDFGLARIIASENLTFSGDVVGTLRYMSPEQAAGSSVVDQRTDVYSLGLTLYELVTGQQAYPATEQQQLILQLRESTPERPAKLDPRIPRDLETIILKAVEKDPHDRYDSANDMADDLRQFINHRPIRARRASRWEHVRRWMVRNPLVASLAAAIVLLLLAAAIGSSHVAIRASALAKRHEKGLYARDIRLAQQAIQEGRKLDAEGLLLKWVSPDPTTDHRRIEWYYLWEAAHDPAIRRSIKHQVSAFAVRFLGQGNKLAVGWLSDKISLWDLKLPVASGPERELKGSHIGVFNLEVLGEGDLLIAGDTSGHVIAWDAATGQPKWQTDVDLPPTTALGFSIASSTDNAVVAIGAGKYESGIVQVHDLDTGERIAMSPRYPGRCWVAFSPSGKLIVGAMNHPYLDVYEPRSLHRMQQYPLGRDGVTALLLAQQRRHLLAVTHKQLGTQFVAELEVRDATTMEVIHRISIDSSLADCLALSPNEDRLAAGNEAGYLYLFDDRYDVQLKKRVHSGMVSDVTFSADGRLLATTGNDSLVHVWDVPQLLAGDQHQIDMQADLVDVQGVGFLDATTAWTTTADGTLFCWDTRTGQVRRKHRVAGSKANLSRTAVSREGHSMSRVISFLFLVFLTGHLMVDNLPAQEGYYFFDDFEDGVYDDSMPSNWGMGAWSGGSLYVDDGDLHIEACQLAPPRECTISPQNQSGSLQRYDDVSLRLQTQVLDGDVSIAVWGRYSGGPVYYGFIRNDNVMGVGDTLVTIPGNRVELPFSGDVTSEDVVMKVDFIGDETSLAIWPADGTPSELPVASFRDDRLRSGNIGITNFVRSMATGPTSIVIRWIEVAEILPGDVDTNSAIDVEDIDHLTDALLEDGDDNRYDVDRDGIVSDQDREVLVHEVLHTWYGDADLNGEFNSGDLVAVFAAGEYEDASDDNSGWAEGDWNGDRDFTSTDLVIAFQDGGYEQGPRPATNAVPEPTSLATLIAGLMAITVRRRLVAR